ncbi:MAG: hypothetical protein R2851_21595 [Caldilineaceae bacterium]
MLLRNADFGTAATPEQADVLIVNTCGFLEAAKEESIGVLQELAAGKRHDQILVAAGRLPSATATKCWHASPPSTGCWAPGAGWRCWSCSRASAPRQRPLLARYNLPGRPGP